MALNGLNILLKISCCFSNSSQQTFLHFLSMKLKAGNVVEVFLRQKMTISKHAILFKVKLQSKCKKIVFARFTAHFCLLFKVDNLQKVHLLFQK